MRNPKTWISVAILLVLAIHVIPIVYGPARKTMWPILAWSMYKDSRPAGPIAATKRQLIGVTSTGKHEVLSSGDAGSSGFAFQNVYLRPMWLGDTSAANQLFAKINFNRTEPYVEFRLEGTRYAVTDTGISRVESPPIVYRLDSARVR